MYNMSPLPPSLPPSLPHPPVTIDTPYACTSVEVFFCKLLPVCVRIVKMYDKNIENGDFCILLIAN